MDGTKEGLHRAGATGAMTLRGFDARCLSRACHYFRVQGASLLEHRRLGFER
jgi:hypothetical protein